METTDDIGLVIYRTDINAYLGHNDAYVSKLRHAVIFSDLTHADTKTRELFKQADCSLFVIKPVLITLM